MLTPLKCKQQRKNFAKFFLDKYHVDDANSDVNEMWSCIPSNLLTTLENNIPSELSSSKLLPPWINNETKRHVGKKNYGTKKPKQETIRNHRKLAVNIKENLKNNAG